MGDQIITRGLHVLGHIGIPEDVRVAIEIKGIEATRFIELVVDEGAFDGGAALALGEGHTHLVVNAPPGSNGLDAVELWMSDPSIVVPDPECATHLGYDPVGCDLCATAGCDPNAAFDSLLLGFVNLFDIHPVSCPNPLNLGGRGVLPAAVLGSMEFDVSMVMPATCKLCAATGCDPSVDGVAPLRWAYEDVSRPYVGELVDQYSCTGDGPDGFMDLTLKFSNRDVAATADASPGDTVIVKLACTLTNGDVLWSEDIMKVN